MTQTEAEKDEAWEARVVVLMREGFVREAAEEIAGMEIDGSDAVAVDEFVPGDDA